MSGVPDPRYVQARRVLLDAFEALQAHRRSIVLIGAQAVYHWTTEAELHVAPFTTDADLALDPRGLGAEPLIESALAATGFTSGRNPGEWIGPHDVIVDILVPLSLASPEGRRGARLPPHSDLVARKADGIEGCLVDVGVERLSALEPEDSRSFEAAIAGPAALMVAKLIKLDERVNEPPHRRVAKDALDVHRLLVARSTEDLAMRFTALRESDLARVVTARAIECLGRWFAGADAAGPQLIAQAIGPAGEAEIERQRSVFLARALLNQLQEAP